MATVDINGTSYAVGLWWQLHTVKDATPRDIHKQARFTAIKFAKYRFMTVAITGRQFALGTDPSELNPDTATYALAASFQPPISYGQGFIGIFNLGIGWWVCSICNAIVVAEGDQLFAAEAEARKHADSLANLFSDTKTVICSSLAESEAYLTPLLYGGPLVTALSMRGMPKNKRRGINFRPILGMALVLALGFWAWNTLNNEAVRKDLYRYFIGEAAYEEQIQAKNATYFPRHWKTEPAVNDVKTLCFDAILSVPLISHGWEQQSAMCTPSQLVVDWSYRPEASFLTLPAFATLLNPKQAKSVVSLPKLPARSNPTPSAELFGREEITLYFYEMTRLLRCKLSSLQWQSKETRMVSDVMLRSPFIQGSWVLTDIPATFVPDTLFMYLAQFKELSITEIAYSNAKWTVKGKVYANTRKL